MNHLIQLSLPLSATALRIGASFLDELTEHADVIRAELNGGAGLVAKVEQFHDEIQITLDNIGSVASPIDPGTVVESEADRIKRLHGNVASAGGDTTGPLSAAAVFGGEVPKSADAVETPPPSPTAVVAPTAPVATPVADSTPSGAIATDKAGLPWHRRIHSESKSINKGDGLWRAKRGRDESIVPGIEAELRTLMAAPIAPVAPVAPKPDLDHSATAAPAPVAPVAPTAPPAPTVTAPASTTPKNLGELMVWAQAEVAAGRIANLEAVRLAAVAAGVAALPLLGTRPDLVPVVYASLGGV